MTAEERSAKWIAELDEVDEMSPEELHATVEKLAREKSFLGVIASLCLSKEPQ